jgi:hypothetical protein
MMDADSEQRTADAYNRGVVHFGNGEIDVGGEPLFLFSRGCLSSPLKKCSVGESAASRRAPRSGNEGEST